MAVIVVTRCAHGACVRVERATPRAAPRESAIAPRALGLIPGQRTVAPPRGVAAAVAAQPGCRSRSRVPPDRGADAEGDVEFGLCGTPPQEHLPFTMRGVAFAALRPSLPGGSLRRTSTGWGCLLLSSELGAGKRRVAGVFPPLGFDVVFRAHAGHAIRAHAGHATRPSCSVIGRRALAVAATPPSSFLAPPSPWRRRQPCRCRGACPCAGCNTGEGGLHPGHDGPVGHPHGSS